MFKKLLIANRGEIAVRIVRACKDLGLKTVAIHTKVDSKSMHVLFADEAVCLEGGNLPAAYLNIENVIAAAKKTGADAIHPGYGFLSENANFAQACKDADITWVGPTAKVIRTMGDKTVARTAMIKAKVPIIPGVTEPITEDKVAIAAANKMGFPVIIKAAAGGGGRGMRICADKEALVENLPLARQEAQNYFGNPAVYIEKYIAVGRHIEVQLLRDTHGTAIHAGERNCSIQRRHQKLIEETPSPGISQAVRDKICNAAVKAAQYVHYTSAGTIEFLMDLEDNFYFMEMNTRIQVEHTVSEILSGIDLIKAQILIAAGAGLNYKQKDINFRGHAIECRVNAEDPTKGFMPSPGVISRVHLPAGPGVRVDTHIYPGYEISPYYDSMIAKVITWGEDRTAALNKMARALREFQITGVKTNIGFHLQVLNHSVFRSGNYNTRYINDYFGHLLAP